MTEMYDFKKWGIRSLKRCTREKGFDFHAFVTKMVKLCVKGFYSIRVVWL
jgi:hypothetical protein